MAATPTLLTAGTSTGNPATTASVSPTSGRLLELDVIFATTSGVGADETDLAVSGLGATWVLVATVGYKSRRVICRYRAESDGTSGTIELTYSGPGTFAEMAWALKEWSGQVQGNNGADAVGTPDTTFVANGTSMTVTIGETPSAGDATSVVAGLEASGSTGALEAGYTEVSDEIGTDTHIRQMLTGWEDAATDTDPTITWSGSSNGGGALANLIVAGAAAAPQVTAAIGLTVGVGGTAAAQHQVTAAVPLTATVTAGAAATHEVSAAVALATSVAAAAATQHQASAPVPLGVSVGAVADAPTVAAEVTATIPLNLAVAGSVAAQHQATAAVSLSLAVAGTTAAGHRATAAVPLAVAVAPVTSAPVVAGTVTAAIPLTVELAADTATEHQVVAQVPVAVVLQPAAAVEHQASAPVPLGVVLTGTAEDPASVTPGVLTAGGSSPTLVAAGSSPALVAGGSP